MRCSVPVAELNYVFMKLQSPLFQGLSRIRLATTVARMSMAR